MGVFPSGQRGQTVNLLSDDYDGSNPSAPTKNPNALAFGFLNFMSIFNEYACFTIAGFVMFDEY